MGRLLFSLSKATKQIEFWSILNIYIVQYIYRSKKLVLVHLQQIKSRQFIFYVRYLSFGKGYLQVFLVQKQNWKVKFIIIKIYNCTYQKACTYNLFLNQLVIVQTNAITRNFQPFMVRWWCMFYPWLRVHRIECCVTIIIEKVVFLYLKPDSTTMIWSIGMFEPFENLYEWQHISIIMIKPNDITNDWGCICKTKINLGILRLWFIIRNVVLVWGNEREIAF